MAKTALRYVEDAGELLIWINLCGCRRSPGVPLLVRMENLICIKSTPQQRHKIESSVCVQAAAPAAGKAWNEWCCQALFTQGV